MFDEKDVRELVAFRSAKTPVLSLYTSTDPSLHTKEETKLRFKSMLKQATALGALSADAEQAERFLEFEYDWQSKGVALFSCQEEEFWRAIPLSVPVPNQVFVAQRPYVKPLSDVLDEYGRYAVLLLDQESARLVMFRLGVVEEKTGTIGEELKRHKQGGWAAARLQRREESKAHQNLKSIVKLAQKFCNRNKCKRLVIGGTDETVSRFMGMLPKSLGSLVVGTIPIEIAAPESEILARSQEAIEAAKRAREAELVQQMVTAATKGGPAAIGLADTIAALQEGRARSLLVADGFRASAYRCEECGYLSAQKMASCAYCGGPMAKVEDVVDTIVRRAIEQGVDVELVVDNDDLVRAGSIGALLRY